MLKHLSWIPWIMAALVIGILACLALAISTLFFQPPQAANYPGAVLVMEEAIHALA